MKNIKNRAAAFAAVICSIVIAFNTNFASAQSYPNKPIHIIVPYPAGGPNDTLARLVGQKFTEKLGGQVVIENRPGAGGNIAAAYVAKSPADGYTILLPAIAYAVNPFLFDKSPYQYDNFTPVGIVAKGPLILVAHPSLNLRSVRDLISLAKSKPGQITFASGGTGSSPHLAGELFKTEANIDITHIPYKGTSEFMADLMSGRTSISFANPLVIKQHIESGALNALAVTSSQPTRAFEKIPAIAQSGVPTYEFEAWYALMAPSGTPNDIIGKLNRALIDGFKSSEVNDKLTSLGIESSGLTPKQTENYINSEISKWGRIIKLNNIKAD
jgi:tripartite-type tricarboxylate transporter receptor subunit TctC